MDMNSRFSPQLVIGVLLALLGVLLILDNTGVADTRFIVRLWPVALVVLGGVKLAHGRSMGSWIVGGGLIFFGAMLTLDRLDLIDFRWRFWWPLILVFLGILMIVRQRVQSCSPSTVVSNDLDATAILGGLKHAVRSQQFQGGKITAILGGCDLDLRPAVMRDGEAVINVFAMWGGISLKIPPDWTVVVENTAFLGGVENETHPPAGTEKRLVLQGTIIMGGIEIKN
jgi:predicted membrane protein